MTLCLLVEGDPAERVLLGCKKAGLGAGKYTGFGGKVEPEESVLEAAAREMWEESGVQVRPEDLHPAGELHFVFPHRPAWSQLVYLFLATEWRGEPRETGEMRPAWFSIDQIPYERMWQDGAYWLPPALMGGYIRGAFTFWRDAETVWEAEIQVTYPGTP